MRTRCAQITFLPQPNERGHPRYGRGQNLRLLRMERRRQNCASIRGTPSKRQNRLTNRYRAVGLPSPGHLTVRNQPKFNFYFASIFRSELLKQRFLCHPTKIRSSDGTFTTRNIIDYMSMLTHDSGIVKRKSTIHFHKSFAMG